MAGRYEVYPDGDEWRYRHVSPEGTKEEGGSYPSRSEAIAAVKAERGDTEEILYRADGSEAAAERTRGPESIVLLRRDGSVYGELDHEQRKSNGKPQVISITPASESDQAVNGNG